MASMKATSCTARIWTCAAARAMRVTRGGSRATCACITARAVPAGIGRCSSVGTSTAGCGAGFANSIPRRADRSRARWYGSASGCTSQRRRRACGCVALPHVEHGVASMIREILKMGDPRLLRVAPPVPPSMFGTAELNNLITDMFETMQDADGVGLAAPQIGVDLQLVVFGFEHSDRYPEEPEVPRTILLNPLITPLSRDMEEGWEGCLSVPGLRGVVSRHSMIRYQGVDPSGTPIDRTAEGFHARVVQHECDHLIGRLYPSRITDFSRFGFIDVLFPEEAGQLE